MAKFGPLILKSSRSGLTVVAVDEQRFRLNSVGRLEWLDPLIHAGCLMARQ